MALRTIRMEWPEVVLSVDTFRPNVARMVVEEFGAAIINDVSGGCKEMFRLVTKMGVPYVLTSQDGKLHDMMLMFAERVQQLRDLGQKDIILDPGFGFGKTLEQNYEIMNQMERLQIFGLPVLVGISRKSMIYRRLGSSPAESLNGTTVLNTISLLKGASILRVHDVREAVETVKIVKSLEINSL
jgi:Dihydropteroate synthase and related enzymes